MGKLETNHTRLLTLLVSSIVFIGAITFFITKNNDYIYYIRKGWGLFIFALFLGAIIRVCQLLVSENEKEPTEKWGFISNIVAGIYIIGVGLVIFKFLFSLADLFFYIGLFILIFVVGYFFMALFTEKIAEYLRKNEKTDI
jgi:hypothetical protein